MTKLICGLEIDNFFIVHNYAIGKITIHVDTYCDSKFFLFFFSDRRSEKNQVL